MFDLSLAEIFLVVVVAVIFIGPKEMPAVIRAVAKGFAALKGLSREVKKTFDELAKESGLKDAADEFEHEVRMIQGDDGNWYESYHAPSRVSAEALAKGDAKPRDLSSLEGDPSTALRSGRDKEI